MERESGLAQIRLMVVYLSDTGMKKYVRPKRETWNALRRYRENVRQHAPSFDCVLSEMNRARPTAGAVLGRRGPLCTTPRADTWTSIE